MKHKVLKKSCSLLLAMMLALSLFCTGSSFLPQMVSETVQAEETAETEDTIHIASAEDLEELAENAKLDSWSDGKKVVLDNDIDLGSAEFTPIVYFNGELDGQGYEITGLKITAPGSYTGFIGTLGKNGKITNLNLSGTVNPSGAAENVGGIVGINNGTISSCSFSGVVNGSENTGAIVGQNTSTGTVRECKASGNILGKSMTGGIAGNNSGILFNCENDAAINTVNKDSDLNLSDLSLTFSIDLSSVSSLDLTNAVTDAGGIAGYSDGNILGCINNGAVGYSHVGYNIGGIAGRSCGYLLSCTNHGVINGRKDVGGIIGQMEPNVDETESASSLKTLRDQMDQLNALMDQTQADAKDASQAVQDQISSMANAVKGASSSLSDIQTTITGGGSVDASGTAGGEIGGTSGGIDSSSQIDTSSSDTGSSITGSGSISGSTSGVTGDTQASGNITGSVDIAANTNLDGIRSVLSSLGNQIGSLSGSLGSVSDTLDNDLTAINNQLDTIYNTTFDTIDNLTSTDLISDTSTVGIDDLTFGKASLCENDGAVAGDLNVGGIAGIMAQEYSVDPEDDLTQSIDVYEKKSYEVKAVVYQCINRGKVTAKNNYAGGITGRADLGFLYKNENYGRVQSESGSYVGGIAGLNTTIIRNCYAKCALSGESYVGGICGSGIQENADDTSSEVYDCATLVDLSGASEYYGAISGTEAGTYARNYFVSETLSGLNQLNSTGKAEPISFEDLQKIPGIPSSFASLTVTFYVDGSVFDTVSVSYGGSIADKDIPAIPADGDTYCRWDRSDFTKIYTDLDVEAVYSDYTTAQSAGGTRSDGRSALFVEGNFTNDQMVSADLLTADSAQVKAGLPAGTLVMDIGESWKVEIPDDGMDTHTLRYLMPDGNNRFIRIYQKNGSSYQQLETSEIGSYLAFEAEGNEVEFAVVKVFPWKYVLLAAAAIAGLIFLLITFFSTKAIHGIRKKKKKAAERKAEMESRQKSDLEEAETKIQQQKAENEQKLKAMEADPDVNPALLELTRRSMDNEVRMLQQDLQIRMLQNQLKMQEPEEEAEPEKKPVMTKRKKVRKHVHRSLRILVLVLLLIGGTVGGLFIVRPAFFNKALCALCTKSLISESSLEMNIDVTASVGSQTADSSFSLARAAADDGTDVMIVKMQDTNLYYADSVIYLENGNAWSVSELCPDYGKLTDLLKSVSEHTTVSYYTENSAGCYEFHSTDDDAEALFAMLYPAEASEVVRLTDLDVVMKVLANEVSEIDFTGEAVLSSGESLKIDAVCDVVSKNVRTEHTIPSAVSKAIAAGDAAPKAEITSDMLTLLLRMGSTVSRNPLTAEVTLEADCGILDLNTSFSYTRTTEDDEVTNEIEMNGVTIHFENGSSDAEDASGNPVESELAELADSTKLIDLIWNLCMTTETSCKRTGSTELFTMALDEDTMKEAALDIAPSLEDMNPSFENGTITLKTDGQKVTEASISCTGTVKALVGEASAKISAKIEFTDSEK